MRLDGIQELKRLAINVGSVFRIECFPTDGVVPKDKEDKSRFKYIVIVGIDEEGNFIGASLINSQINERLRHLIAQYQKEINADSYSFLEGKSRYVDCYKIITIKKQRILDDGEYIGNLKDEDICIIKELLKTSPIIDQNTIARFDI